MISLRKDSGYWQLPDRFPSAQVPPSVSEFASRMGSRQWSRLLAVAGTLLSLIVLFTWTGPAADEGFGRPGVWSSRPATSFTYTSWTSRWKAAGKTSSNPIYNSTLGFGKIFAITLANRHDRRQELEWAAQATNLDITYFDGVLDADIPKAEHPQPWGTRGHGKGQLGCLVSQVRLWRHIIEQNLTSAIVLESDADWDMRIKDSMQGFADGVRSLLDFNWPPAIHTIGDNNSNKKGRRPRLLDNDAPTYGGAPADLSDETFSSSFESAVPSTSNSKADPLDYDPAHPYGQYWDILYMGSCGSRTDRDGRLYTYIDPAARPANQTSEWRDNLDKKAYPRPGTTRIVYQPKVNGCNVGYAISNRGARKMIEIMTRRADVAVDTTMQIACQMPGYMCVSVQPPIIAQAESTSNMGHDSSDVAVSEKKVEPGKEIHASARVNGQRGIHFGAEGISEKDWIKEYVMPGWDEPESTSWSGSAPGQAQGQ